MNTKRVKAAGEVILAAQKRGHITASGWAVALESACMLQSPETVAEQKQLQDDLTGACLARYEEEQENARLRLALASAQRGRREARETARNAVRVAEQSVAELKREHATNAALRARVAELESAAEAAFWNCEDCSVRINTQPCPSCEMYEALEREAANAPTTSSPDALTQTFAPVAALREDDPFHLRHAYRLGRDLPQPGAAP